MPNSVLTETVFNAPHGLDETTTRIWLRGKFVFGAGNYAAGGLLPNLTGTALAPIQDASGQNVLLATYTQPTNIAISGLTVSGTTCVFLTANPPTAGQYTTFSGFTDAKSIPFNGVTAKVASVSAGVSFTCTITTTATTVTNPGTAVVAIGPDDMEVHSITGSGYTYRYNKTNGTIQIFINTPAGTNNSATPPIFTGTAGPAAEYGDGTALAAGITGDTIHFVASWAKQ